MKPDLVLKADVHAELAWDPAIHAAGIGVAVRDGVVTLTGHLATFAEKHAVEQAVRRVAGVRGIAVELDVMLGPAHQRSDTEIVEAALAALANHAQVPAAQVKVEVQKGWVELSGTVPWHFQSRCAEQAVGQIIGVRGITNAIVVQPHASSEDIARHIAAALSRHAVREAHRIAVEVDEDVVTLRGPIDSLAEREAALGAARSTRGVARVIDALQVGTPQAGRPADR
jgi:osmotically-inducible protein OsmY